MSEEELAAYFRERDIAASRLIEESMETAKAGGVSPKGAVFVVRRHVKSENGYDPHGW